MLSQLHRRIWNKSSIASDVMVNMGYVRKDVEDSLAQNKYDDITATYLLLGRRTTMVSIPANVYGIF